MKKHLIFLLFPYLLLSSCQGEKLTEEEATSRLSSFYNSLKSKETPVKYTIKTTYSSFLEDDGKEIENAKKYTLIDESKAFFQTRVEGKWQEEAYFHERYILGRGEEYWRLEWLIAKDVDNAKTKKRLSIASFSDDEEAKEAIETKEKLYHEAAKSLIADIAFLEKGNFPYLSKRFETSGEKDLKAYIAYGQSEREASSYRYFFKEETISFIGVDENGKNYESNIVWNECDASSPQLKDYLSVEE